MAYSPTDWADGVTPVDEAHLDKIEQGIVTADANASAAVAALPAKEDKSAKGAASGYAPLDAGTKVPLAYLPPVGADLSFDGDWVAGTYQDGDVVVKDGVSFMCVGGPTTVAPDPTLWGSLSATIPPLVEGKWLKVTGGVMVWSDLPAPAPSIPIGATVMWPTAAAVPTGWMKCDGSAIPVGNTAAIAVLGANVPDMRGRAPFGVDTNVALAANDGQAAGSRGPSHKHTVVQPTISKPAVTVSDPGHSHAYARGNIAIGSGDGQCVPTNDSTGYIGDSSGALRSTVIGMTAALASTPVASGGTVGNQASALVDLIGYFGLHFIVYVG